MLGCEFYRIMMMIIIIIIMIIYSTVLLFYSYKKRELGCKFYLFKKEN